MSTRVRFRKSPGTIGHNVRAAVTFREDTLRRCENRPMTYTSYTMDLFFRLVSPIMVVYFSPYGEGVTEWDKNRSRAFDKALKLYIREVQDG